MTQAYALQEREVTIGKGQWSLPATLTLPEGTGPFPGVVLVHGSGPHDRDETVMANKPFRDIAFGLAEKGIAVLRYEKRTKFYAVQLSMAESITVKEEVTEDASTAVGFLSQTAIIDHAHIFLLGHSLGGMLAPRIAEADPRISGIIILAGNTRPLEELIIEQTRGIFLQDGVLSAAESAQLAALSAQAAQIKEIKLHPQSTSTLKPFGVPAAYWLDLSAYDPVLTARRLNKPILILQGERDYQVTLEDFDGWKKGLSDKADVTFKVYPAMNHLFIEGAGKSTPLEYRQPGHIAAVVLEDCAAWILQQR